MGSSIIDQRTRRDDEPTDLDVVDLLDRELPRRLHDCSATLPAPHDLPLRTFVLHVGDRSWILRRAGDGFDIDRVDRIPSARVAGSDRVLETTFTEDQFLDLVTDQITPVGMMTAGTLSLASGRVGHLLDWWLVLRSALDGLPIHRHGDVALPDDLDGSFTLDDDPTEIRDFLAAAGYLHLRGVFTPGEMARISDEMDRAAPSYRPDDHDSWWATLADGTEQVVRMQRFHRRSPAAAALLEDPRLLHVADLGGAGHRLDPADGNPIEALFKPLGVVSGISDVPWHKDCSLGRHSYECCSLTVGISVTAGGPTSGQLHVVAGSHRALMWPALVDVDDLDLPDVALPTSTGDVTVHLSCTMHMAEPPTEVPRRVMYTGFRLPPIGDGDHAMAGRRRLAAAREAAPTNTSQAPVDFGPA